MYVLKFGEVILSKQANVEVHVFHIYQQLYDFNNACSNSRLVSGVIPQLDFDDYNSRIISIIYRWRGVDFLFEEWFGCS